MTLPTFTPDAFDYKQSCGCEHCECTCNTCRGIVTYWYQVGDRLTDRHIILPANAFDPKPARAMAIGAPDQLGELLDSTFKDEPSTEYFHPRYLDPLEAAGLRVRPLVERRDDQWSRCHGITYNGAVVGLLMPLNEPQPPCRMAIA